MRKRTARILRRAADRLDPKPARWYAARAYVDQNTSAWQQSATTRVTGIGDANMLRAHRRRVLADFLSPFDLKKLRP